MARVTRVVAAIERRLTNLATIGTEVSVTNRYDVHLFAIVRVKVSGVEAESQQAAIAKTVEGVDLHELLDREGVEAETPAGLVTAITAAEEIAYVLVDEWDDPGFARSQHYQQNPAFPHRWERMTR